MKKLWKALGITALAALVPIRIKKDENGTKSYQSLLWKLDVLPDEGEGRDINVTLMDGVLTAPLMNAIASRQEAELFTDDPEEAILFAGEMQSIADEAQEEADMMQDMADSAQDAADAAQAMAEEVQEAAEADFDPEF